MENIIGKFIGLFVTLVVFAVLFSFIMAWPVMWLWNSTFTELFSFKQIDWWMAWKLSVLTAILFKSAGVSASKS
jgi:hypothetical protein